MAPYVASQWRSDPLYCWSPEKWSLPWWAVWEGSPCITDQQEGCHNTFDSWWWKKTAKKIFSHLLGSAECCWYQNCTDSYMYSFLAMHLWLGCLGLCSLVKTWTLGLHTLVGALPFGVLQPVWSIELEVFTLLAGILILWIRRVELVTLLCG